MPGAMPRPWELRILSRLLALAALPLLAACAATSAGQQPTPSATLAATAAASPTSSGGSGSGIEVKVFFSKRPESDNNVQAVFAAKRIAPDVNVATYATQQLIAGPTANEKAQGYYTELTTALTGASNCSGADFQITLDTHIDTKTGTSSAQPGAAVVKFCRATQLAGDLTGARIKAQLNATLTQFATIKKVQILTSTVHCFDDASGQDIC
jgi:hypothetical protein